MAAGGVWVCWDLCVNQRLLEECSTLSSGKKERGGGSGDFAGARRWLMLSQPGCASAVNSHREAKPLFSSKCTGFDSSLFICSESAEVFLGALQKQFCTA